MIAIAEFTGKEDAEDDEDIPAVVDKTLTPSPCMDYPYGLP